MIVLSVPKCITRILNRNGVSEDAAVIAFYRELRYQCRTLNAEPDITPAVISSVETMYRDANVSTQLERMGFNTKQLYTVRSSPTDYMQPNKVSDIGWQLYVYALYVTALSYYEEVSKFDGDVLGLIWLRMVDLYHARHIRRADVPGEQFDKLNCYGRITCDVNNMYFWYDTTDGTECKYTAMCNTGMCTTETRLVDGTHKIITDDYYPEMDILSVCKRHIEIVKKSLYDQHPEIQVRG